MPGGVRLRRWVEAAGPVGVCAYLAGFGIPFGWDLPLGILALCSLVALTGAPRRQTAIEVGPLVTVIGLVASTALSTAYSVDVARSVGVVGPLLPALLIVLLLTTRVSTITQVRALCLTLSAVALALGCVLLSHAWQVGWRVAHGQVRAAGIPILVEANDVTLLAIVAPLSFVLGCRTPRRGTALLALASIVASASAASVLQSRVAILTLVGSLTLTAALLRPRLAIACGASLLALVLLVDAFLGFPLVMKFSEIRNGRLALWLAAWSMFLDAPWLGHGPRTFRPVSPSYLSEVVVPAGFPIDTRVVPWPHNLYLEMLSEQGLIGFAALVIVLGAAIVAAWRARRVASDEDIRLFGAGLLGALIALSFAASFELTFLRRWVVVMTFTLVGLSAALGHAARKAEGSAAPSKTSS